ncbi:MAG: translation initiation factor IF-2 [Planctomycetes bacterium]|nr:translation initiation factor IF-2 [Planctomycetota bacterium]
MATKKTRVHQLAKELGIDSKLILEEATRHGIDLKNHMAALEAHEEMMLRAFLEDLKPIAVAPAPAPEVVAAAAPADSSTSDVVAEATLERTSASPQSSPATHTVKTTVVRVVAARAGATAQPQTQTLTNPHTQAQPQSPKQAQPDAESDRAPAPGSAPTRLVAVQRAGVRPSIAPRPPDQQRMEPQRLSAPPTRVVRVIAGTTPLRTPDAAGPSKVLPPRRTAEILGRKELPAQVQRPGHNGLIATRTDGGSRTFVVTGRRGPGPMGPRGPMSRDQRPGDRTVDSRGKPRPDAVQVPEKLTVQLPLTVKGLSEQMAVKANVLIQRLFVNHKRMVKINDPLDKDTIELLGIELNCEITCEEKQDIETEVIAEATRPGSGTGVTRAPIITFLGHVDHGKTSLLDAIRKTNVASKEHGGITQHIGATRVDLPDGRAVVFLDTPGHRAFTEMRARGAQVTDVVVLVVAADDGVMPQTKEAIAHAKAANVPIVVALNKIDKPEANLLRVRQELAIEGLQDEKWGGQTTIIETSATTKQGIQELLEHLALESDILELRADPTRPAIGTVIEAQQSKGEGSVARLIINDGTLRRGDIFLCGVAYGRIRAIKGPSGKNIAEAGPSMPVEITGLNELPKAGDKFYVVESLDKAKEIAGRRAMLMREKEIAKATHISLESLFHSKGVASLKLIIKSDVTGSLEVLRKEIADITHPEIRPEIIHAAVGGITETDVALADASDAVILGFHVSADMGARQLADRSRVEIRIYQVIYKLIEELRDALAGKLAPELRESIVGEAVVRQVWKVSRIGTIAGCMVTSGLIKRTSHIRVSRGGIVVASDTSLESLKRVKDDVKEVKDGLECGMVIARFENIEEGDVITAFDVEKIKRSL